jgi:hypothetical protein
MIVAALNPAPTRCIRAVLAGVEAVGDDVLPRR